MSKSTLCTASTLKSNYMHQYAADIQFYTALSHTGQSGQVKLEKCLSSMYAWFCFNHLAMNPDWVSKPTWASFNERGDDHNGANPLFIVIFLRLFDEYAARSL